MGTQFRSIPVPEYATRALALIEEGGFEGWLVGGFVRDALREHPCSDIDIATSAHWESIASLFSQHGYVVHETGVKHGTVTVVINNNPIEITTYRNDGAYRDGRHPDSVTFVDTIEEDLARRDFTINALAYHPNRGIVDPFRGVEDLKAGILRAVGNPNLRFREDALRILRACRFHSQLGFTIESETFQAMMSNKHRLSAISSERVTREIELFVTGPHVHDALLKTCDVLSFVLPELVAMKGFEQKTPYHRYDVLEHTAWVMHHTPPSPAVRWAALLHDMGKPGAAFFDEQGVEHFYGHGEISERMAAGIISRLSFSHQMKERVLLLVKHHDDDIQATSRSVRSMLARLGNDVELLRMLYALKRGDALAQAEHCFPRAQIAMNAEALLDEMIANQDALTLKDLAITGHDVVMLGVEPGARIRRLLEFAFEAIVNDRIANDRENILRYLEEHIHEVA